jgi:hypothetical protein
MHRVEPASPHPMLDGLLPQPQFQQLSSGHDAVLPNR